MCRTLRCLLDAKTESRRELSARRRGVEMRGILAESIKNVPEVEGMIGDCNRARGIVVKAQV